MRIFPIPFILCSAIFSSIALSAPLSAKPETPQSECREMPGVSLSGLETAAAHKKTGNGKGAEVVSAKLARCSPVTDPGQDPLTGLPPDPGEAGKATLEGIDSDGDGVRDDVQRWIVMTYPNEPAVRRALAQSAKAQQASLMAGDTVSALRVSYEKSRAMLCLIEEPGYEWSFGRHIKLLRSVILNTYDRSVAYIRYNKFLGGQVLRMPEYGSSNCDE